MHESVGGQKTAAKSIDMQKLSTSNNYSNSLKVKNLKELNYQLKQLLVEKGPSFLEIITKPGSRENLGRPTIKPSQNKENFMRFLKKWFISTMLKYGFLTDLKPEITQSKDGSLINQ